MRPESTSLLTTPAQDGRPAAACSSPSSSRWCFFQFTTNGVMLKPLNVTNVFLQNGYILVMALGMLLVIVIGHIDLSVGSVAGFLGAIVAVLMVSAHLDPLLAVALTLVVGGLIGVWQGFWVAYLGVPSFIVTLAGMLLFRGATLWMLGGQPVGPFPDSFRAISSGFIPELIGTVPDPFGPGVPAIALARSSCPSAAARSSSRRYWSG